MLLAVGAYLLGWHAVAARLEAPGRWLWARVSPVTRRLLPADTPGRAFAAGLVWGWLPCGLVYSMLTLALLSGGAAAGAGLMAAFGLGTLPNLLLAGTLMRRIRPWLGRPLLRKVAGGVVLAAAVGGLAHASEVAGHLRRGLLCVV
jgi:sulfite exporter TauE/SafE